MNFSTCQCWHMVLAPYKKINLLPPTHPSLFYFRVPCLFLWDQKFSPLISYYETSIDLPRTEVTLSPMAVSIAAWPGGGAASFRQLEQQLECISYSELVIGTFHFSWSRNRCTAAEEGTGKCQKMRKPVEQSVLCRRGSPQIKSYFRIDQIHMRPATVAIVTNKYAWLPEALPRKRTVTLVMKFVKFVSPLCSKVLIVTNYS